MNDEQAELSMKTYAEPRMDRRCGNCRHCVHEQDDIEIQCRVGGLENLRPANEYGKCKCWSAEAGTETNVAGSGVGGLLSVSVVADSAVEGAVVL